MTAPDDEDSNENRLSDRSAAPTPEEAKPGAERNALLAAACGTILDLRSHLADLRATQDFLRLSRETAAAEARELRERLADLRVCEDAQQAEQRAREDARLAERNWLIEVRDAHAARLRELEPLVQQIAPLTEERNALACQADALNRLARELRWESAPRSLRVVLPLARLLRRMSGG